MRKFKYLDVNVNPNGVDIPDFTEEERKKFKKRIAIDFDGVIHTYENGWQDGKLYGDVMPGAIDALLSLKSEGYELIIHTARVCNANGTIAPNRFNALVSWLNDKKVPYDGIEPKIPAMFYIDDRAINCNPLNEPSKSWERVLRRIEFLKEIH